MALLRQTWTLTRKNLLIVLWRAFPSTTFRALVLPVVFMFFISYAKNFFVAPSEFGVGTPAPVRSLADAFTAGSSYRDTIAFVNNGFTGGDIQQVINTVSQSIRAGGKNVQVVENDVALLTTCPSSLQGTTHCFAAATFHSSPTQGPGGVWNYTLHGDGYLGTKIYVNHHNNDQEIYVLPFQRAIDSAIARISGTPLPDVVDEYPFTDETNEERNQQITKIFQSAIINILAVVFFIAMVGVTYQLVGHMASERELGMSQLIEAMMPNKRRWEPQLARLVAYHIAFDIIYTPGWIIMGAIVNRLVFPDTSGGIVIVHHLLTGFALASFSLFCGSFFRKAQLSGITTTILSLILAIIAQVAVTSKGSTGAVIILSLLFPPMNYIFFMIGLAKFEHVLEPGSLTRSPPYSAWGFPLIIFWILLIVQIFVFPVLAALMERRKFGTASTDRKVLANTEEPSPVAVRLKAFTKVYRPRWFQRMALACFKRKSSQEVRAVDSLSLDVLQGQIFVLLGANGSGKSTTLDAIAGLNTVTEGSIEIDGRGGLGLCPQKNVLWDEVTVLEHVKIFNRLKETGKKTAVKQENLDLISACDLGMKSWAKSKTLSGGQKRKLQLAMMFTGGSRVCCVDEVSSGIDPLARRKVWDILLRERGRRTILLTTHFLDEADVLSDHIAILSKGILKDEGSAVELKHRLGGGYRVSVEDSAGYIPGPAFGHVSVFHDFDQTVYGLQDSAQTADFISSLERHGYTDYKLEGPTVENVFLHLADELKDSFESGSPLDTPPNETLVDDGTDKDIGATYPKVIAKDAPMHLLPGKGTGLVKQAWILFRKRFTVLRFNYMPYVAAVLLPIVAAGLVTLFLTGFGALTCSPSSQASVYNIEEFSAYFAADVVYGPPDPALTAAVQAFYPDLNSSTIHTVNTLAEFNNYISANYGNVVPGGFFLQDTPTFAYVSVFDVSSAALVQNLLNQLLAQTRIVTGYQYFASIWAPNAGKTLQLVLYFGLAMSAYPGFFALYVTGERRRNVRALHYSNGVRSLPLWIAYVTYDFIFVMLISVVVIALFRGVWDGWYYPGYLFVVFFLYGLTSVAFSYAVSLFATSQLAAFAISAGTQAVMFLLYFIAYMCIITYVPAEKIQDYILVAHFTIATITPSGNLLRSLLLTLNEFSILCHGHSVPSYGGDMTVFGGPILYLVVQFILLMTFVIWWDSGGRIALFRRSGSRTHDTELYEDQDPEVLDEVDRVENSSDALRVLHLTKSFGTNTAVDDVTFGIQKGECFALLGPNGAGKSTTISLIRGDARFSTKSSSIFVEDISLATHRVSARNHLGVCPQFDAMDMMTVREHLRFYARARGVPDVDHNANEVMRAVGITQYADRMAINLSGGNKRKLSLAIALMGNPSVLLLDEPSSGMDAAAKRVMWRVLGSVKGGRALLITTHSMEEADALAQRAGIMARRMLALGDTDTLRKRHGNAHHVHIVHASAPHTPAEEMESLKRWVRENIPGAEPEERTYHGQLRFSVPNPGSRIVEQDKNGYSDNKGFDGVTNAAGSRMSMTTSTLFRTLEAHKEELNIAYYSVSPTTLDQVFLNVVNKHNVQEENSTKKRAGGAGRSGGFMGFGRKAKKVERVGAEEIA